MIVPTVIITLDDGSPRVFNLSQFVEFIERDEQHVLLSFANGEVHHFFNESAAAVKAAIVFLHNTYQEQAKILSAATQQVKSGLIVPNGGPH